MAVIPERPASAFFQKASTPTPMGETTPRPVTTTRSSRPDEDENIGVRRGLFAPALLGPSGLTVEDIRLWSGLFAPAALIGAPGRFAPGVWRTCPPFYSAPSSLAALAKS